MNEISTSGKRSFNGKTDMVTRRGMNEHVVGLSAGVSRLKPNFLDYEG